MVVESRNVLKAIKSGFGDRFACSLNKALKSQIYTRNSSREQRQSTLYHFIFNSVSVSVHSFSFVSFSALR